MFAIWANDVECHFAGIYNWHDHSSTLTITMMLLNVLKNRVNSTFFCSFMQATLNYSHTDYCETTAATKWLEASLVFWEKRKVCSYSCFYVVKQGFFWSFHFMMVSVSRDVLLLLPPPNLCLGTVLFGNCLAAAKSLMMVAFPFPLHSNMTFIGIFLASMQEYKLFLHH